LEVLRNLSYLDAVSCGFLSLCAFVMCTYLLTFVSDIAVFVLKRDVKLQPTNQLTYFIGLCSHWIR